MATKGSFEERAAHLSYAAPLIAALIASQLGRSPPALLVTGVVVAGGLFAAITGLRWSKREHGRLSRAAMIGLVANCAFVFGWAIWTAAS